MRLNSKFATPATTKSKITQTNQDMSCIKAKIVKISKSVMATTPMALFLLRTFAGNSEADISGYIWRGSLKTKPLKKELFKANPSFSVLT
jgi:hypothetical protein